MTTEKKNFKDAHTQKIDNHVVDFEEMRKAMKSQFGIDIDDVDTRIKLRKLAKKEEKEEIKSWSKPNTTTTETTDQYKRRMSQGDKGFFGGLATAAGIWLLSKVGQSKPQPQVQPLTADEEFEIVEKHLMRDAYLRHISRQ